MPALKYVPFGPIFMLAPLGPTVRLAPVRLRLTLNPGRAKSTFGTASPWSSSRWCYIESCCVLALCFTRRVFSLAAPYGSFLPGVRILVAFCRPIILEILVRIRAPMRSYVRAVLARIAPHAVVTRCRSRTRRRAGTPRRARRAGTRCAADPDPPECEAPECDAPDRDPLECDAPECDDPPLPRPPPPRASEWKHTNAKEDPPTIKV